jgi:hypothetical protein
MDLFNLLLGRKPKREDDRTLRMAHYFLGGLPPTPAGFDWSKGMKSWGAMLNDRQGCCTCSEIGHQIQAWTQIVASLLTLPDSAIETAYVAVTGEEGAAYNPATGANDNGCNILDVLNYWRQVGVGGHKILAYAAIDHTNKAEVLVGGLVFGGLYAGVNLPLTAKDQIRAGQAWDVPAGGAVGRGKPRSWGGHAVYIVGVNAIGPVCITWGQVQQITWAFWFTYFDEAYVVLSADWMDATGVSGSGFDLATMQADLAAITGVLPTPIPVPPTPVPPNPVPPTPAGPAAQVLAADDAEFTSLEQMFASVRGASAALAKADAMLKAQHQAILKASLGGEHPAVVNWTWQRMWQDFEKVLPEIEAFAAKHKA